MFLFLFIALLLSVLRPTDDTDKSWYQRSGMTLYTDYGTGLQFVKLGLFGPTFIRTDKNGRAINIYDKKEEKEEPKKKEHCHEH